MTTTFTMRIDGDLKADAEKLFDDIGLNLTTAITSFLKKCVAVGGMPFILCRKGCEEKVLAAIREQSTIS